MVDKKMKDLVREMVNGTQEEMDKTMNKISKGLYKTLKEKYPDFSKKETIDFAKAIAVAHIRATAATMNK